MRNMKSKIVYIIGILVVATACLVVLGMTQMLATPVMIAVVAIAVIACLFIFMSDRKSHLTHD